MNAWAALLGLLPFAWARYAFMQHALLAVLLVAPLFALLGSLAIGNQMAFFSDAIGHACLTGIAIGVLLGAPDPTWAMAGFAVALALLVSLLRRRGTVATDALIGLVMAFGMALGVVLLSRGGGFARYARYLIGDILTLTPADLGRIALLLGTVVLLALRWYNPLQLAILNRSLAQSRGGRVWLLETGFAAVLALVVAVCIQWVGLLVIHSLLIVPAAAARNLARNAAQYLALAVGISWVAGVIGLLTSFYWGTATGATIVLVALGFYLVSLAVRR